MSIIVCNTQVSMNKDGLYSLNDLHKAAGGENRHRPSIWVDNNQTKELIEEISKVGIPTLVTVKGGKNQGTYACKELLFAYALWIDNRIFLKIIKAVDDLSIIQEALNNFEVPDDIPDMYVYAIKNTDTGNIKLGISKNPEQRLKQLQIGCDGKLELVAYRKADKGYQDEVQLHHENSQYAIHGEWFTKDAKFN